MLESMSEVYEKIVENSSFILEPVKRGLAEELINMGQVFTILSTTEEQWVFFEVMLEKENKQTVLNVSTRHGCIESSMEDMPICDVFYTDDFGRDGFLVSFDTETPFFGQLEELVDLTDCHFFFGGNVKAKDMQQLPHGRYLLIDGGELLKKVREMGGPGQNTGAQERSKNF